MPNGEQLRSGRDDKGGGGAFIELLRCRMVDSRSLHFAQSDFLWNLVALIEFMRLSLTERRTGGIVWKREVTGCSIRRSMSS
jgi:hypothetical protein